jgi:hypothetical protein
VSPDSWQSAVAAARIRQKPLYLVETIMGTTVDACTSLEAARQYVREANCPHLYRVFERHWNGAMYQVTA